MTTQTENTTPLAELMADLADPGVDYELSVTVQFALAPAGKEPWTQPNGEYELGYGRWQGRRWLRVSAQLGEEPDGLPILGEKIVDLSDEEVIADPLALLRSLFSGGTA